MIKLTILIVTGILTMILFFTNKSKSESKVETIEYPPFTILKKPKKNKSFNMNSGRMASTGYTEYSLLYKGLPIKFPSALEKNTTLPGVWKAYILKGAPKPTILAGSQSLYLITEVNDSLKITPLNEQNSDFASLQWMDEKNDQPGLNQEVYISNDSSFNCVLEGGEYLLVNKSTMLRVSDLAMFNFDLYHEGIDYYATKAIAFSPAKNEIVYVGSKYNGEKSIYALMVFDYNKNTVYAVPFDQTETRMQDLNDINYAWINTFFVWQKTESGSYVFKKREMSHLPFWQGRFSDNGTYYNLLPVKEDMRHILADFVLKSLSLDKSAIQSNIIGENIDLNIQYGNLKFTVGYWASLKNVHFAKYLYDTESEESLKIVKKIGNDFNHELKQGKYQDLFTSY